MLWKGVAIYALLPPVSAIASNWPQKLGAGNLHGWKRGGAEGNRTPDLLIANEALSQLSYSPTVAL